MIEFHRLFGLTLMDFFTGSYYDVELEKNLTLQEQFLDVIILKKAEGNPPTELPDGLENLLDYNLITYKSLREPLNDWALDELIGYYTLFRKQVSPSLKELLPIEVFQLYAVCTRRPHGLEKKWNAKRLKKGVYEIGSFTRPIRIILLSQIAKKPQNALWHLFGGHESGFVFGDKHYRWHSLKAKQLLNDLYKLYLQEEVVMPYTLEDYYREHVDPYIESLPPAVRLKGISPQERLKGISPKERLKGISPKERLKGISSKERLQGLPPEEIFQQFSPEVLEKYLSTLKATKK